MSAERIRVCAVEDLVDGEARRFDVDGERVAVVRLGEVFHAIGDRCSHANYSLSGGEVDRAECQLECPKHGSEFSLLTGVPASLPALRPVKVYDIEVDEATVWLRSTDSAPHTNQENVQ